MTAPLFPPRHTPLLSNHKARTVRILNPVGRKSYTSRRKATEYVGQGRAQWADGHRAIRFIEHDHRHCSARQAVSRESIATLTQIAGIPVIHPEKLIAPSAPNRWWWEHAVSRRTNPQPATN